ncbi:MAG: maleylpyruvate isomerase N-terminal domain-containing protein [Acidimicrobiales bacterium]
MAVAGFDYIDAIAEHSAGLAVAAEGNLARAVEHCPGWTVADLVRHVTEVHWFWGTIAEERLEEPPDEARKPAGAAPENLIDALKAGADRLGKILRAADGKDHVWTWAPAQQNIDFITRHQVQEAAVHHWDAVHAAQSRVTRTQNDPQGVADLTLVPALAADCVAEFLSFSVSTDADPAEPARADLGGRFALCCSDVDAAWTLSDGSAAGTVRVEGGTTRDVPTLTATASELLLWLYARVEIDIASVPADLVARFRALCFTD